MDPEDLRPISHYRIFRLFLVVALLAYAKDTVSSIPRTVYGNILTQEATESSTSLPETPDDSEVDVTGEKLERETVNFFSNRY